MAENSWPWNVGIGDGVAFNQNDLRIPMSMLLGGRDGVLKNSDSFDAGDEYAVTSPGNNLLDAGSGYAIVDGTPGWSTEEEQIATSSPSTGTTGRLLVLRKSWTSRTVRLAITSSPDGTAAIPDPVQVDGVTWELPLASFTITTGGVISALTDVREFIGPPEPEPVRGWTFIAETVLGSAASSVSFASLDTSITRWRVSATILKDGTAGDLLVRCNNDSGNNYARQSVTGNASSANVNRATAQSGFHPLYANVAGPNNMPASLNLDVELLISKPVTGQRGLLHSRAGFGADATPFTTTTAGFWLNTANLIDRIDLVSGSGNFAAGTRVLLEGFV